MQSKIKSSSVFVAMLQDLFAQLILLPIVILDGGEGLNTLFLAWVFQGL